jgi:hypothetical protein
MEYEESLTSCTHMKDVFSKNEADAIRMVLSLILLVYLFSAIVVCI